VGFGLPTRGFAATEAARPKAVRKKVAFILEEVGVLLLEGCWLKLGRSCVMIVICETLGILVETWRRVPLYL
jgi:hypothetical protein